MTEEQYIDCGQQAAEFFTPAVVTTPAIVNITGTSSARLQRANKPRGTWGKGGTFYRACALVPRGSRLAAPSLATCKMAPGAHVFGSRRTRLMERDCSQSIFSLEESVGALSPAGFHCESGGDMMLARNFELRP